MFTAALRGIDGLTGGYTTANRDLLATTIAGTEHYEFSRNVLDTAALVAVFIPVHRHVNTDEVLDAETALKLPTKPSIFVTGRENVSD